MASKKMLPIMLAFLMIIPVSGAGFSAIHSYPEALPVTVSSQAVVEATQGGKYFEVYSTSDQILKAIEAGLNSSGVSGKIVGYFLQLDVPPDLQDFVAGYLNSAQSSTGIRFFQINDSQISTPYITFARSSQYAVIPYAYVPSQIASAYGFNQAYSRGLMGNGTAIGIVDAYGDPNLMYDTMAFDKINGLPALNIQVSYPEGRPAVYNSTWALETATDVEWAHAMAPGARILLYVTPSDSTQFLQSAVSAMIANGSVNVISISWGNSEVQLNRSQAITYGEVFQQAAEKGIMVFAASGDYGSYYYSTNGSYTLSVNFPASDPYVTAVGGSSLYLFDGKFNQTAWGEDYEGKSVGSGGGYSRYFTRPYWQKAPGFNSTMRGVPDVSMDANQYTGMVVVANGAQYQVGGTSIATPIWAAIGAIIEERYGKNLGNLDPLLYEISRTDLYASSFTQITTGTNGYYSAGPGWNPVTGLGTPKVPGLLNATGEILKGFGGIASLYGNASYADDISSHVNVTMNLTDLKMNGTDFYFIGFRGEPGNSTEFGIAVNSTGIYYNLRINQNGNDIGRIRYLESATGTLFKIDNYHLSLAYTNGTLTASANGNTVFSLDAFLSNFGNMTPVLGVINYGSFQNSTFTGNASFQGTLASFDGIPLNISAIYYSKLSGPGSNYSSLGSEYSNGTIYFSQALNRTDRFINGSVNKEYAIEYHLGYSRPLLLSLYLKGYGRSVKWELDNTTLQTNSYSLAEGGYYTIHASIIVSGLSVNITRTISVPYMKDENITVLSNVPGYGKPSASLIVNYFYSYSLSGEASVPVINGTNAIQVSAPGFRSSEIDGNAGNNVTVILQALPVRVSLFLFPANVNVTLNGVRYYSNNGTYSGLVEPGYAIINVSSPGFVSVAENVSLPPGINYTSQLSLEPLSPGWTEIYGNVIDSIYSFPVSGAMVSLANRTYAFTNSTGFYMVYATNDSANVSVNASLYAAVHENVILKGATELNFSLKPLDINTSSFPLVKITRYFPLLFFMGIVTWTEYTGHSFLEYQIYISRSPSFQNPEILTFTANTSTSTVIFGVYPGQTYYATIVLRLSNGEVFQSQTVRMGYENPVYLTVNIAIGLGMAIYLFMTVSYLRKRWKKPPVEI